MTIYQHAHARMERCGMTAGQATEFLGIFARTTAGQEIPWQDVAYSLWGCWSDPIDRAASRWLLNPGNAAKPEPMSVRAWREGQGRDCEDARQGAENRSRSEGIANDEEPDPPEAA